MTAHPIIPTQDLIPTSFVSDLMGDQKESASSHSSGYLPRRNFSDPVPSVAPNPCHMPTWFAHRGYYRESVYPSCVPISVCQSTRASELATTAKFKPTCRNRSRTWCSSPMMITTKHVLPCPSAASPSKRARPVFVQLLLIPAKLFLYQNLSKVVGAQCL